VRQRAAHRARRRRTSQPRTDSPATDSEVTTDTPFTCGGYVSVQTSKRGARVDSGMRKLVK